MATGQLLGIDLRGQAGEGAASRTGSQAALGERDDAPKNCRPCFGAEVDTSVSARRQPDNFCLSLAIQISRSVSLLP